jgi:hypothetical protein
MAAIVFTQGHGEHGGTEATIVSRQTSHGRSALTLAVVPVTLCSL